MPGIDEWGFPVIDESGYRRLATEAGSFQEAMELLQVRLAQDFLNIWATIPPEWDRRRSAAYLTDALADMQIAYGTDSAAIAAQYLDALRQGEDLPMVLAEPADPGRVGGSVRWALTNPMAQELLWGAMQRMALEPYRETIRLSAFEAGNGFARVPEPGACSFCLMLAARGAVFSSSREAERAGHARWSKSSRFDKKYHDHCKCEAVEVSSSVGLPEANVVLAEMWQDTFYDKHGNYKHGDVNFNNALPVWSEALANKKLPWMSGIQLKKPR